MVSWYIESEEEIKNLRKIAKMKLPRLGTWFDIAVADGARAECRWCRKKIKKGQTALKLSYSDGRNSQGYQVHQLAKECHLDPRLKRKLKK